MLEKWRVLNESGVPLSMFNFLAGFWFVLILEGKTWQWFLFGLLVTFLMAAVIGTILYIALRAKRQNI